MRGSRVKLRRALVAGAVLAAVASATAPVASAQEGANGSGAWAITATPLVAPDGSLKIGVPVDVNQHGHVLGDNNVWNGETVVSVPEPQDSTWLSYRHLNDRGQVAGDYWTTGGVRRPLLWNGGTSPLIDMANGQPGAVADFNNRGQAVINRPGEALLYHRGETVPIVSPVKPEVEGLTFARALNDRGTVAGYVNTEWRYPFTWRYGSGQVVVPPEGTRDSDIRGINDRGQVVAQAQFDQGVIHPYLWSGGTSTSLHGFPGGGACYLPESTPALNIRGDVIATCTAPDGYIHAVRWRNGQRTSLAPAHLDTMAFGINDKGHVTGTLLHGAGSEEAFLWRYGELIELGVPAGYDSSRGLFVTEDGDVVGYATSSGSRTAFVWSVE